MVGWHCLAMGKACVLYQSCIMGIFIDNGVIINAFSIAMSYCITVIRFFILSTQLSVLYRDLEPTRYTHAMGHAWGMVWFVMSYCIV